MGHCVCWSVVSMNTGSCAVCILFCGLLGRNGGSNWFGLKVEDGLIGELRGMLVMLVGVLDEKVFISGGKT